MFTWKWKDKNIFCVYLITFPGHRVVKEVSFFSIISEGEKLFAVL